MSEKRFNCLVCKNVKKYYDDEIVGFTNAECKKGHKLYPNKCNDFKIKLYWKLLRKSSFLESSEL